MATVTIKSAGEQYHITVARPPLVSGNDERFAKTISSLVDAILDDYSPALGGQASFVAIQLQSRLGVTVVSVEEPPSEEGVVY